MKSKRAAIENFKESIFAVMSKKAVKHGAINLSQGFPDFDGPEWARDALAKAALSAGALHQYAPAPGDLKLRELIADSFESTQSLSYHPQSEVTITNGATEAIFSSVLALVNPGDEVIIFEPFYDSYLASIEIAGGIPVPVTLHAPEFRFKEEELAGAFSAKTKLVIWNSPHNPTGRVFDRGEIDLISKYCQKYDSYVLCDEVYEYLTFDHHTHQSLVTRAGMRERTIVISSIGKTFGHTGWKIGWALAPMALTNALRMVHQFNTFSVNHPAQVAARELILKLPSYLAEFRETYQRKRDLFCQGLEEMGSNLIRPEGTYFVMVPIESKMERGDIGYCQELIETKGVAAIPPSAFYLNSRDGEKYLRFCFAKKDETLRLALERLGPKSNWR